MSEPVSQADGTGIRFISVDCVTHEEDRLQEARFWAARTIAERVIAGWELAEDDLLRGGEDDPKNGTGITLRRVSRSGL